MSVERHLRGACSCGRNRYIVQLPTSPTDQQASIFFDNTTASRRHQAAPFTAWLRVPLSYYQSATYALFPDETHTDIRRTYTTPSAGHERRQFCGFCGTQLSSWNETTREAAEFISLTLGSVLDEDLEELESSGLLPSAEDDEENEDETAAAEGQVTSRSGTGAAGPAGSNTSAATTVWQNQARVRGAPWFESMIEDSVLGRIRRRRGGQTSRDGTTTVEWEIIETDGDGDGDGIATSSSKPQGTLQPPGKRKLGETQAESTNEDVSMS